MYKEIRAILSSSCLSEDTHGCECDGNCYEHENAKIEELIAKHDSDLLDKVAEKIKNGCICTDYSCGVPFNKDCENCNNNMIDFTNVMEIIAEMKAEVENGTR